MGIDLENLLKDTTETETGFEHNVTDMYNIISSGDAKQYVIKPNFRDK